MQADEYSIEWNLQSHRREIKLIDGSRRWITATLYIWNGVDRLIEQFGYTGGRLVQLAEDESIDLGIPFDIAFIHIVGYLNQKL